MSKGKPTQFRSDKVIYCHCMPSIFDCIGLVQSQVSIIHFRQLAKQLEEMRDRDILLLAMKRLSVLLVMIYLRGARYSSHMGNGVEHWRLLTRCKQTRVWHCRV